MNKSSELSCCQKDSASSDLDDAVILQHVTILSHRSRARQRVVNLYCLFHIRSNHYGIGTARG